MFEKDATSAAIFVSSIDRSADSSCVKPIPCATAPKVAVNCCASPTVRPAICANPSKNLVALSAAVPKVVPKAAAASSALTAAFTALLEKSINCLDAKIRPPAIAVFCSPDNPD